MHVMATTWGSTSIGFIPNTVTVNRAVLMSPIAQINLTESAQLGNLDAIFLIGFGVKITRHAS